MIWSAFKISLLATTLATSVVVVIGTACAFILAKGKFRGREALDALITLPLVLPPTVTGYYLIVLFGRRGLIGSYLYELTGWTVTFTLWAAVIAASVMALPLMVKSARAAIESVNPQYELASYTLGKGKAETFFRITLPLARRGVLAGVVLSFARALGEFGATLMLAGNIPGKTQTMPLAIYEAVVAGDNRQAQMLALILTAVSLTAIYLTNKLASSQAHSV
ncbi:MAG: Molybdenum transport system permease protein ModB [Acidobacteria bacterium]|nr:Molybdenum transport system permease protein ModB [Acidobacteriota bacterium]